MLRFTALIRNTSQRSVTKIASACKHSLSHYQSTLVASPSTRSLHSVPIRSVSNDMLLSVSMNVHVDRDAATQREMVDQLQSNGVIKTERVRETMAKVDRQWFARLPFGTPVMKDMPCPYAHAPSPIGQCSTISSPYSHAIALEALAPFVQSDSIVLDVGSGSGYLTACFGEMIKLGSGACTGRVVALEHSAVLIDQSKLNIAADPATKGLIQSNETNTPIITFAQGDANDSTNAWLNDKSMLFDIIHVGVAFPSLPLHFLRVLKVGGRMLIPVGPSGRQKLTLIEKLSESEEENVGYNSKVVMACSYANIAARSGSETVAIW